MAINDQRGSAQHGGLIAPRGDFQLARLDIAQDRLERLSIRIRDVVASCRRCIHFGILDGRLHAVCKAMRTPVLVRLVQSHHGLLSIARRQVSVSLRIFVLRQL
jgi:hypothetical protein